MKSERERACVCASFNSALKLQALFDESKRSAKAVDRGNRSASVRLESVRSGDERREERRG